MSAISPSSASESAVQSFVSTAIAISVPGYRPCSTLAKASTAPRPTGSGTGIPAAEPGSRCQNRKVGSGDEGLGAEQLAEGGGEAVAGVDVELGGQAQVLAPHPQEHGRVARVGRQHLLEPVDQRVAQGVERQPDV